MREIPVLVIERSELSVADMVARAPRHAARIKNREICIERYIVSQPTIYIIHPSESQAYLSRDMQHPHYQVQRRNFASRDLASLRAVVDRVSRLPGNATNIIEIDSSQERFEDDFLIVVNNPDLSLIDREMVEQKLEGKEKDPERNNICLDLGYSGQHNTSRNARYLGLPHSNKREGTMEEWSQELFVAVTKSIDANFPVVSDEVYHDIERNQVFAGEIHPENRVEALRLSQTKQDGALLNIHCDVANCLTAKYSFVSGFTWSNRHSGVRTAVITYGKAINHEHMQSRELHKTALLFLRRLFGVIPQVQKCQGTEAYGGDNIERFDAKVCFLDKGNLYSLFATAIVLVFTAYPIFRSNILMVSAFLANVVMTEVPDHYWQICSDLVKNPFILTPDKHVTECTALEVGNALMEEIFSRKRGSVPYPTRQRHAPAVNRPPTKAQMDSSIFAISKLIKELRVVESKVNNEANALHYYGKASEFLVDEAFGAGHLTAMHIIGVATCLRLMPVLFLQVAEIGVSTRTWKFLKWAFGYKDEVAYEQTNALLRAGSVFLGIPIMWVEELCCQACKYLSPRRNGYELLPCTIDFLTCHLYPPAHRATGDVVYRLMLLFRIHEVSKLLYCLDCHGNYTPAPEVMEDSAFVRMLYQPDVGFWSRRPKSARTFHYRRMSVRGRDVPSLEDYFRVDTVAPDEYMPPSGTVRSSSRARAQRRQLQARNAMRRKCEHIGFGLYGPHQRAVIENPSAIEPLDLKQLVWEVLGGQGKWRKSLFRVSRHAQPLVRPPGTAPDFAVIGKKTEPFWSCQLMPPNLNASSISPERIAHGAYYTNPSFDMIPCTHHMESPRADHQMRCSVSWPMDDAQLSSVMGMPDPDDTDDENYSDGSYESDDSLEEEEAEDLEDGELDELLADAGRRVTGERRQRRPWRVVDYSDRLESCWPWNECRQLPCEKSPYGFVLAVRDKKMAVTIALLEFIFNNLSVMDIDKPQCRSLLFFDEVYADVSKANQKRIRDRLKVDYARDTRIFYDPSAAGSKHNKLPFLIAVQYPRGGCAYYLCDDVAQRVSQPLLKKAFPVSYRAGSSAGHMYEFICIVSHRTGKDRSCVFSGCGINLIIRWKDGSRTEEPMYTIFKDCPLEVVAYAENNNLLAEPCWARVKTARDKHNTVISNREYGNAVAMMNSSWIGKEKHKRGRKRKHGASVREN